MRDRSFAASAGSTLSALVIAVAGLLRDGSSFSRRRSSIVRLFGGRGYIPDQRSGPIGRTQHSQQKSAYSDLTRSGTGRKLKQSRDQMSRNTLAHSQGNAVNATRESFMTYWKRLLYSISFVLLSSQSFAQEATLSCGNWQILQSNASIEFIGEDATNAKAGDRRILNWRLSDLDGTQLGTFHVVTTVLGSIDGIGDFVTADGSMVFPNGEVFVAITATLQDAADTERSGHAPQIFDWAILGGTGDFANAKGTLKIEVPNDNRSHLQNRPFIVEMSCD